MRPVAHSSYMSHYFFNLHNDRNVMDPEGTDLPDLPSVREHAVADIRELMAEGVKKGSINFSHSVEVSDENGRLVLSVPFLEAVNIAP